MHDRYVCAVCVVRTCTIATFARVYLLRALCVVRNEMNFVRCAVWVACFCVRAAYACVCAVLALVALTVACWRLATHMFVRYMHPIRASNPQAVRTQSIYLI